MALQAARRKHQGPRQQAGSEGRWVDGVTPEMPRALALLPGCLHTQGCSSSSSALILRDPSRVGTSTSTRDYGGLIPTQRSSQLLAKSPSPSLDAVSITLMWACTMQTWASITLMWASAQHGQGTSRHEQPSSPTWASISHCGWSLGSPAVSPQPQAFHVHWLQAPKSGPPRGRRWVWGQQQHPRAVEFPQTQHRALWPVTHHCREPQCGLLPKLPADAAPHTELGPNSHHRVTHTLTLLNVPLVCASCPAPQHLLQPGHGKAPALAKEPQNYGMVWLGKDFKAYLMPLAGTPTTPGYSKLHPTQL